MTATSVCGSSGVCERTASVNAGRGSGGVCSGTVTAAPESETVGVCDGSVTTASERKGTIYNSKRPRDEATQDPRVSCAVECSVLPANRHLTCIN